MSLDSLLLGHNRLIVNPLNHLVFLHELIAHIEILEHLLNFFGELIAALSSQLSDHQLLSVTVRTLLQQQPPAKTARIKLLKDVLRLHVPKDLNDLFDHMTKILLALKGIALGRFLEVHIQVLCHEFS